MRAKGDCQLSLHTHPPVLVQWKHLRSARDSWVQRRTPGNTQPHLNSLAVALVQVWQDLMQKIQQVKITLTLTLTLAITISQLPYP